MFERLFKRNFGRGFRATAAPGEVPTPSLAASLSMALAALLASIATGALGEPAPAAARAAPAAPTAPSPARGAETSTLRVIEDDQVRIEEVRVRGQLARITVAPKASGGASAMRAYEINVGTPGRDPSQDRSAAGQRVWSVLRW